MTYSYSTRRLPRIGLLCILAASVATAHADLKVVSNVVVTGKRGPKMITAISYFKGSLVRIDNGPISRISDSKTHKTILMNNEKKVFGIANSAEAMKKAAASIKEQGMKFTAHIKPTGKTKMIAGRMARQYVGDLTAKGKYPPIPGSTATVTFQIDEWTTTASGVTAGQGEMMGTISELIHTLGGMEGMKQATQELSKIKGIPLVSKLTGSVTIFASSGGAPKTRPLSYDTEAIAATEGTLPMSLFQVPKGYKQEGMNSKAPKK